jgi:hypothetical protein
VSSAVGAAREVHIAEPGGAESHPERRVLARVAEGGARFERVVFTRNRRVMVSIAERGRALRLHALFEAAPEAVLRSIGRLFSARTGTARARAKRELHAFLQTVADRIEPPRRRPGVHRPRPADRPHLERLAAEFARVNQEAFGGSLPMVPLRLCGRMKRRNGHFRSAPLEIAISRALCEHAAPGESERTLRHEMIHLWQHVTGGRVGHGPDFRARARTLGVHPRATREVCWLRPPA